MSASPSDKENILDNQKNQEPSTQQLPAEKNHVQLSAGTTLVNRYLIQDVIGVGGMGSVYLARDLHFQGVSKMVAVKEMVNRAPDPQVRKNIVKNFEREANLLATLSHASIPRIYDYFSREDKSYLVLEFIRGKDLETMIQEAGGFLAEELVLGWAIELCEVLQFLHTHQPAPIVFRDMKPSNVMVTPENHIVLVDFGIAKPFQGGQKGTMIGTEGYSPPEQYRGDAGPQADLYALGATLHHALTRRDPRLEPPFSYNERPVRKINPSVSAELEAVINAALQYNTEDRFKSAEEMKEALEAAGRKTGILNGNQVKTAWVAPASGIKPLWTFECEDEIRGTPLQHQGWIFIGSYDNNLYCLNMKDGRMEWKYATQGGIVTRPAAGEDMLFTGSEDMLLHAVNWKTGKVNWTYPTGDKVHSSPRIAEGHVFFGSDDHFIHAVNLVTGRAAWKFETAAAVRSTPFINQESVFAGCESGDFYCINFHGSLKWHFKAKMAVTSSPLESDGVIYFGSIDGSVYALDSRAGWVIWRFRLGKGTVASPCKDEGRIYIGCADGNIYAIDARNARELWRSKTSHQVVSTPVIHRDALYCGSADGSLYCLEARTGRQRWKFSTRSAITGSPLVHDDMVFIGSTDHCLYCLPA